MISHLESRNVPWTSSMLRRRHANCSIWPLALFHITTGHIKHCFEWRLLNLNYNHLCYFVVIVFKQSTVSTLYILAPLPLRTCAASTLFFFVYGESNWPIVYGPVFPPYSIIPFVRSRPVWSVFTLPVSFTSHSKHCSLPCSLTQPLCLTLFFCLFFSPRSSLQRCVRVRSASNRLKLQWLNAHKRCQPLANVTRASETETPRHKRCDKEGTSQNKHQQEPAPLSGCVCISVCVYSRAHWTRGFINAFASANENKAIAFERLSRSGVSPVCIFKPSRPRLSRPPTQPNSAVRKSSSVCEVKKTTREWSNLNFPFFCLVAQIRLSLPTTTKQRQCTPYVGLQSAKNAPKKKKPRKT